MSASRRAVYGDGGWGAWRRSHARAFADARQRLRQAPLASLVTVLVLAFALLLPLLMALGLSNALRFAGTLEAAREVSVFLKPDASPQTAAALADAWRSRVDVAAVQVRTPEQGLAEFKQMSDLAGALDLLDANPLPFVLVVSPSGAPADLAKALQTESGVDSVQFDAAWRERLDAWLAFGARAVFVLAVLLGVAAVLVVGNTVRLDLAARRDEIALLQQLGADDADVRRPLLYLGVVYGVLAGAAALLGVIGVGVALSAPLDALVRTYAGGFSLSGPSPAAVAVALFASALLGWLGARVAAGHYLRTSRPTGL